MCVVYFVYKFSVNNYGKVSERFFFIHPKINKRKLLLSPNDEPWIDAWKNNFSAVGLFAVSKIEKVSFLPLIFTKHGVSK